MTTVQTDRKPVRVTLTERQWADIAIVIDAFMEGAHFKELINAHEYIRQDELDLDGITHAINAQVMEAK